MWESREAARVLALGRGASKNKLDLKTSCEQFLHHIWFYKKTLKQKYVFPRSIAVNISLITKLNGRSVSY
jgi:hypothetical protein